MPRNGSRTHASVAQHNDTVTHLNLRGCKIGDKGNLAIASALQINTTVRWLDVGHTDMEAAGIIAYCTVLRQNNTLKSINFDRPLLRSKQVGAAVLLRQLSPARTHIFSHARTRSTTKPAS